MSIELASLKERKKEGEKSIFDCIWFSRKTVILESRSIFSGSISHVDYDKKTWICTYTGLFSVL